MPSSQNMSQTAQVSASAPLVSVCLISYNHSQFIERALRSVLEQQLPFPIEIVIADDCSTDDTERIARRVASESTATVRFLARPHNLGPRANVLDMFAATRGKYIAYLEGDDCWVDSNRLATQVAILEADPGVSGCFGRAVVVDESGSEMSDYFDYYDCPIPPAVVDQRLVLERGSSAPSCTLVFRGEAVRAAPEWYKTDGSHQGMSVLIASLGLLRFVDKVWGQYRIHNGGVWSQASIERRTTVNLRFAIALASDSNLTKKYPKLIGRRLVLTALSLARQRVRSKMGIGAVLNIATELSPALTLKVARAVVVSAPDLAAFAYRRFAVRARGGKAAGAKS